MGVGGFQNFVRKSLCGRPNLPTPDWNRVITYLSKYCQDQYSCLYGALELLYDTKFFRATILILYDTLEILTGSCPTLTHSGIK